MGDLKTVMDQWIMIKNQLKVIKGDIKILNTQEKDLRLQIQEFMKTQSITTCNVADRNAKVSFNTRKSKSPFNRELVRKGLMVYFRNDETLVDRVFDIIDEQAEVHFRDSITLKNV